MTANHAHTPHIEEVCSAYVQYHHFNSYGMDDSEETEKSFYRMIATIEAAAEQRGAEKALQDLADNHTVRIPDILGYKVQAVFTETIWEKLDDLEGDGELVAT